MTKPRTHELPLERALRHGKTIAWVILLAWGILTAHMLVIVTWEVATAWVAPHSIVMCAVISLTGALLIALPRRGEPRG
ncbi:hypothetical protein [Nesterenkonia rhizosphaerae]|uniref:Uncharacterized protein n=1 Tax=Nesterenkonia rhizosphaerae TaxID=1348272 RepID=A0ABP9FSJ9_9MICC